MQMCHANCEFLTRCYVSNVSSSSQWPISKEHIWTPYLLQQFRFSVSKPFHLVSFFKAKPNINIRDTFSYQISLHYLFIVLPVSTADFIKDICPYSYHFFYLFYTPLLLTICCQTPQISLDWQLWQLFKCKNIRCIS